MAVFRMSLLWYGRRGAGGRNGRVGSSAHPRRQRVTTFRLHAGPRATVYGEKAVVGSNAWRVRYRWRVEGAAGGRRRCRLGTLARAPLPIAMSEGKSCQPMPLSRLQRFTR